MPEIAEDFIIGDDVDGVLVDEGDPLVGVTGYGYLSVFNLDIVLAVGAPLGAGFGEIGLRGTYVGLGGGDKGGNGLLLGQGNGSINGNFHPFADNLLLNLGFGGALYLGHAESGGVGLSGGIFAKAFPDHAIVISGHNLPPLAVFKAICIGPAHAKQVAVHKVFGKAVHVVHPLSLLVLAVVDVTAIVF